ncbi:MAG: hypothetical protein Q9181_000470 [Wetmoreana brouardii]
MATFQPLTIASEPPSTEDPMELYPDAGSHQTADDGVDIDLDLTSDPPRNTDDYEMIEDPGVDGKQGAQPNTGSGSDEQMIDEAGQDDGILNETITDVLSEYDDDLEDIEIAEPTDDPDVTVDDARHIPQPAESNLTVSSQVFAPQNTDSQSRAGHHTYRHQEHDDSNSSGDIQPAVGQDLTEQVDMFRQSSVTAPVRTSSKHESSHETAALSQGEFESHAEEAQSSVVENGIQSQKPQGTIVERRTPSPVGYTHQTQSWVPHASSSKKATRSFDHVDAQGENTIEISSEEQGYDSTSFADHAGLGGDSASPSQFKGKSPAATASKNQAPALSSRGDIPHEPQVDSMEQVESVTHDTFEDDAIQESTYMHPVVVLYQENEMYLFPPTQAGQDHNQTFFLSDENLAGGPIGNLFNECRNVLGDSISDQEELEISFEDLGLWIRESTTDTSSTSLVDMIDVFLHLHYNDGNDSPPPMRISLLTNVRFSQRLDYLLNCVAEGKGMSQLESEDLATDGLSPEHPEEPSGTQASTQPTEVARTGSAAEGNHNDRTQSSLRDTVTESLIKGSTHNEDHLSGSEEHLATKHATTTMDSNSENATSLTDDAQLVNGVAALTESYLSTAHTATQLVDTMGPWSTSGPEDSTEGQYDEAVTEELSDEEHPYPDEIEYADEQDSAGSSTVQGDDPVDKKRDLLDEANTFDIERGPNQQQLASRAGGDIEAEDLITYEIEEEDLEYGDDSGSAARWQDTEKVPFVDTEAGTSRSDAPSQLEDASSHRLVQGDDSDDKSLGYRGSNNSTYDHNDSELHHLETKETGLEDSLREEANEEALEPITSTSMLENRRGLYSTAQAKSKEEAEMLKHEPSRIVYQNKEQSHVRDHNLGVDKIDAANSELSAQDSLLPADDEDEITYEDDIEDEAAAAKEPLGVSAGPAPEQAASSSPGPLKRARDDADITDLGDDEEHIDPKRIRSG